MYGFNQFGYQDYCFPNFYGYPTPILYQNCSFNNYIVQNQSQSSCNTPKSYSQTSSSLNSPIPYYQSDNDKSNNSVIEESPIRCSSSSSVTTSESSKPRKNETRF